MAGNPKRRAREAAARAAAPRDPLAIRMSSLVPHKPEPPQHAFLCLSCKEAFYGGAAGGGKSDALLMAALQYIDVPGYAAILFRKTFADLALPGAIMDRAKDWLMGTDAAWNDRDKTFNFGSGASLTFGYLQHTNDRYRYQSAEFQFVGFDELTQFEESDFTYLFSRLRKPSEGTLSHVPLRMRGASNPGGLGHAWVRRRYVRRETMAWDGEFGSPAAQRVFIPAKLGDNPHVDQESYVAQLEELDPQTRAQLLDGNWDAREPGAVFDEFAWDRHTVEGSRSDDSPFPLARGIDFGYHHAVHYWMEIQAERIVFIFAELHCEGKTTAELAVEALQGDRDLGIAEKPIRGYCDPAGAGTNLQTGESDINVLRRHGIAIEGEEERHSPHERVDLIKTLLRQSRLFISRDCPYLIDALERAVWDKHGQSGALKETYRKDGYYEHPLDGVGEALARIFPSQGPAGAAKTVPAVQPVYSGSEFG